jgi:hypothetical protein
VREDYSDSGDAWHYFPHDQARSRAYRWGEDGLAGICDDHQRLCFALALWNGQDPILKERLFGLTHSEGNHGEDVKEYYFYLDSTPTHSYMKYLYKYPQAAYPYDTLVATNRSRGRQDFEYELIDTGVFDQDRYFDVFVEYAKGSPEDILIQITLHNRGPEAAEVHVLPALWFRNQWSWQSFVPNHTGLDHPWVEEHLEYYIPGSELDLARAPQNYTWARRRQGDVLLAHGRDPYFPGWPDTLQLNYGNPALQEAMIGELMKIAGHCDGVRCDMAMLVLPEVFERTWGLQAQPFWPQATQRVRQRVPDFCFMAEVYWDLEWTLQQQGFDYTYDKRLYDRLRDGHARPVREHFHAELEYQNKLARFLENHAEPRAATTFTPDVHKAAAVITFLSPGLRFFHQGQCQGRTKRISPHLCRGPDEPIDSKFEKFYDRLLAVLRQPVVRNGQWQLLECVPAWDGNWTWECFLTFAWHGPGTERLVVTVNYAPNQSQCYVRLPFTDLGNGQWRLVDMLGQATYDREGNDVQVRGLYLDEPPWRAAVFALTRREV